MYAKILLRDWTNYPRLLVPLASDQLVTESPAVDFNLAKKT